MTNKVISEKIDYSSKSKLVQDFLENYSAENTKVNYSSMLNQYFNFLKIEPDSYFEDNRDFDGLDTLTKQIEEGTLKFIKDVENFLSSY